MSMCDTCMYNKNCGRDKYEITGSPNKNSTTRFSPLWTARAAIAMYVSVCVCVYVFIPTIYLKNFLTDFDETWQDDV